MMTTAFPIRAARPAIAPFAAMGVLWGTFAALLPDTKARLAEVEAQLGFLILGAPVAAVLAMLATPRIGAALGQVALPVAVLAMALSLALQGQAGVIARVDPVRLLRGGLLSRASVP